MRIRLRRRRFAQLMLTGIVAAALEKSASKKMAQTSPIPEAMPRLGSIDVALRINGAQHALKIEPRVSLLDALRESLRPTGTKKGTSPGNVYRQCVRLARGVLCRSAIWELG